MDPVLPKGVVDRVQHLMLATWALDCAEHVLVIHRHVPRLEVLFNCLAIGRAWVRGEVGVPAARLAAFECHRFARSEEDASIVNLARSVGHAVATAHVAGHAKHAARYAIKTIERSGLEHCLELARTEESWQETTFPL